MAINPSPQLAILLMLIHLLSAVAIYVACLPPLVSLAALLLVLASLVYHLARDALLLFPASWRSLSVQDGVVTTVFRDGSLLIGQVAGGSVVTPAFVILRVKYDGKYWPVARAIFPDALENDAFRELCVRLKYA